MVEFAVKVEGIELPQWVLAVDPVGDRLLVVHSEDQSLQWHPMADCKFVKAQTPDQPRLVMAVEVQKVNLPSDGRGLLLG